MSRIYQKPRAILSDLDGSLYKREAWMKLHECAAVATAALACGVKLDWEEALAVAWKSDAEHHWAGREFVLSYGVEPYTLHHAVGRHALPDYLTPCEKTQAALSSLGVAWAIATHATNAWALRTTRRLGIDHLFPKALVFGFEDYNEFKFAGPKAVDIALKALGSAPEDTMMWEDEALNLKPAHDCGLQTVFLHHGKKMNTLPDYIDYQFENALDCALAIADWPSRSGDDGVSPSRPIVLTI